MKKRENIWYGTALVALVVIVLAGAFLLTNTANAAVTNNEKAEMILYRNFAFYSSAFTTEPTNMLELELPETIIDESLILTPTTANVIEQSVLTQETELENFIGEQITAYDDKTRVSGKLLDVNGGMVYVETNEGVYALSPIGYVIPEYAKKKTTGEFKLDGEDSQFKVYYAFSGLEWGTDYYLFINGNDGVIKARANINNNCGKDIENAKVKLVAGEINYGQKYYPYPYAAYDMLSAETKGGGAVEYQGRVEQFHVYELENPVSIKDREKKSYEIYKEQIDVNKTLRYESDGYDSDESALSTVYSFSAPREMPAGEVKVVADGMLVGASTIENKGNGSMVELESGKSFDVTGKTETLDYKESILSYEYSYKITVENHGASKENIEVNFHPYSYGDWELYDVSEQPTEKKQDKITWRFELAEGKKEITFKIRYKKV
ncbi:MAG: DUF4139 domain-containing protein [Candidatus Anstonellales archaeon]